MALPIPTEAQEQIKLVYWMRAKKILHFATNNENQTSFANRTAAIKAETKAQAMGKSKGVPDLFIPIANKYYNGLFIELKRKAKVLKSGKLSTSHTKVSPEQEKWIEALREQNYQAVVCYGAEQAIEAIEEHLEAIA